MEKYVETLKTNNLKITPQRLEIMRYLDENRTHPDVEKIYSDLKDKNPSLSKTTIYNCLETLRENNIIRILTISESKLRYDFNITPHHHFKCKSCGIIRDIDVECPYFEKVLDGGECEGGRVEEVHAYFKGTCKDCIEKEGTLNESQNAS